MFEISLTSEVNLWGGIMEKGKEQETGLDQHCSDAFLVSEGWGCYWVAPFSGCLHALESQWCRDITVVRWKRIASSMLPAMASHITRRSCTVGHVRWHLRCGRVRCHRWCRDKTSNCWKTACCLKEKEKSHSHCCTFQRSCPSRENSHDGQGSTEAVLNLSIS